MLRLTPANKLTLGIPCGQTALHRRIFGDSPNETVMVQISAACNLMMGSEGA
jgi:hypothetical protein